MGNKVPVNATNRLSDAELEELTNLEIVRKDGLMLQHIDNQTEKICIEAVKQNVDAYQYVKNKTDNLYTRVIIQQLFGGELASDYIMEYTKN